jgi:predicted TIM-barrel fold metal-dependent hydrolase
MRVVMIIDVHAHYLPPLAAALLAELAPVRPHVRIHLPVQAPSWEDRLSHMAAARVGRQILSVPGGYYLDNAADTARIALLINDGFAEVCQKDPARFSFWASLPLPYIDHALAEIERAFDQGAVGVMMGTFIRGESIAQNAFKPLYAELDRRKAAVFLHPVQNALGSRHVSDWDLTVCCGASMEDSVAALHLIAAEIPSRFPNIRFIVPHLGGILPMLLQRLDGQMPRSVTAESPSAVARRFYYDTVGWGSKAGLRACVEAFGASQVVPGSDYPILLSWESYAQSFAHIHGAGLDPDQIECIVGRNVQSLLHL